MERGLMRQRISPGFDYAGLRRWDGRCDDAGHGAGGRVDLKLGHHATAEARPSPTTVIDSLPCGSRSSGSLGRGGGGDRLAQVVQATGPLRADAPPLSQAISLLHIGPYVLTSDRPAASVSPASVRARSWSTPPRSASRSVSLVAAYPSHWSPRSSVGVSVVLGKFPTDTSDLPSESV